MATLSRSTSGATVCRVHRRRISPHATHAAHGSSSSCPARGTTCGWTTCTPPGNSARCWPLGSASSAGRVATRAGAASYYDDAPFLMMSNIVDSVNVIEIHRKCYSTGTQKHFWVIVKRLSLADLLYKAVCAEEGKKPMSHLDFHVTTSPSAPRGASRLRSSSSTRSRRGTRRELRQQPPNLRLAQGPEPRS
mmetsp:Transcript_42561/g.117810  ORF Transcript_42561/g.117810 Transcript_42561/m.117810 type:complete len:192 (-) Transcript_42561:574-1149(-)